MSFHYVVNSIKVKSVSKYNGIFLPRCVVKTNCEPEDDLRWVTHVVLHNKRTGVLRDVYFYIMYVLYNVKSYNVWWWWWWWW
jgi:hypothetical protein